MFLTCEIAARILRVTEGMAARIAEIVTVQTLGVS